MRVTLFRVRDHGRLIPKYRHAFLEHPAGDLQLREEYVPELGRHTKVARLLDDNGKAIEAVPPLLDSTLLQATKDMLVLTGFERLPDDFGQEHLDYAQTWCCEAEPRA